MPAVPNGVPLFDTLQLLPDQANQRADIRDITVHRQKLTIKTTFDSQGFTGSALFVDMYWGIYLDARSEPFRGPAFSAASDARADWLDCWMDNSPISGATDAGFLMLNDGTVSQRDIKTKRKLQSNQLLFISTQIFPHAGTLTGSGAMIYIAQWQYSALISVS